MVNHPNRGHAPYRFIAWSTISQAAVAHAATLEEAVALARPHVAPEFTEVLACGNHGRVLWRDSQDPGRPILLHVARRLYRTLYAGHVASDHAASQPTWPAKEPPAP